MYDDNRFAQVPDMTMQRSSFMLRPGNKTTFNAGKLVPLYAPIEVLPGDTMSVDSSILCRMSTPVFPVMDNAYLDVFYFYVPTRLLWSHWKEFWGENTTGYWAQTIEYSVPQIIANDFDHSDDNYFKPLSLADYFGLPTTVLDGAPPPSSGISQLSVSALPFRGYVQIWNEWFRDQNTQAPAFCPTGDSDVYAKSDMSTVNDVVYGAGLLPVNKFHDRFTSSLPGPQKAIDPVVLNLAGTLPVYTSDKVLPVVGQNVQPLIFQSELGGSIDSTVLGLKSPIGQANFGATRARTVDASQNAGYEVQPVNLYGDLKDATAISVNDLRLSFAVQKFYESLSRAGSRYTEILRSLFGVTPADASLQRPEFLSAQRIPINIDQVLQTSATSATSPQGNTSAYSLTTRVNSDFTKSFTEHGYLYILGCVRTDHTYQNNVSPMWSRKDKFDYYLPQLAHIGEQPVLSKEVQFFNEPFADNEAVFGYQEAFSDYRILPRTVTGAFKSNYPQPLHSWHYADYFSAPAWEEGDPKVSILYSDDFVRETEVNVGRTLATDTSEPQFLLDAEWRINAVRPMPLYSVPGFVDHF